MEHYFTKKAEKEYLIWSKSDKRVFRTINKLIEDIEQNGMLCCKGKPEQLKHFDLPTYSRRIGRNDRLVYRKYNEDDLLIMSCKGHYIGISP